MFTAAADFWTHSVNMKAQPQSGCAFTVLSVSIMIGFNFNAGNTSFKPPA